MITRFDHAVIAVRDLDEGVRRYRALGFDVRPGGRHEGLGTHNAIIRFGLDYLELISIYDEQQAIDRQGEIGRSLVQYLREHEGGLVGFGMATDDIEGDAERLRRTDFPHVGPWSMQRTRPDGKVLSWRLLIPGETCWNVPWPFLIQWDNSEEERLAWEAPGEHANGVVAVGGIVIGVENLDEGVRLYRERFGLEPVRIDESGGVCYDANGFSIWLEERRDEGPFEVSLGTRRTSGEGDPGPYVILSEAKDLRASLTGPGG